MDNNAVDEILGMGAAEETANLDAIENDIEASTTYTTVGTESTGVEAGNIGMRGENTWVCINTPGVQDTSHKGKNNKGEDDNTREIAYEDILEEDVHRTQITSPT